MTKVVFDLDDWCDGKAPLTTLDMVKAERPDLKVTVFAIPSRSTGATVKMLEARRDWVEVAQHGFFHSACECDDWSKDEALDKIVEGCKRLGIPTEGSGFKAPSWKANGQTYAALEELGMWVADHPEDAPIWGRKGIGVPRYVLGMDPDLTLLHGHTWEIENNGPNYWRHWVKDLPRDAEFKFVSECVGRIQLDPVQEFESSWSHNSEFGRKAATYLLGAIMEYMVPGGKVLDIGGNDGFAASKAREQGHDVEVLDLSPTRTAYARYKLGVPAYCDKAESMPFAEDAYDWGFCSHTLEHVEDLEKALSEIRRVCKQGCFYVIPLQTEKEFVADLAHHQFHTKDEWLRLTGSDEIACDGKELLCLAKF